jgi:DNA-directed RNA polymerase subunit E'/Rpb7
LVEDEVIKGIIEQLTLEGIKGEISAINGFEVNESSVITKNNFVIRKTKTF